MKYKDLQQVLEEVIQVIQTKEPPLLVDTTGWHSVQQVKWLRAQNAPPEQLLEMIRQGEQEFLQKVGRPMTFQEMRLLYCCCA